MGNRDVFDRDASIFVEVPKMMAGKRGSEVGDDAVGETESMDNAFQELDCFLCGSRDKRFVLDPLGELVDGDVDIPESTWRWLERPYHIRSPACERPRSWDGLQFLCWYVYLLGEKLASLASSNEVFCIGDGHGPVKTSSESFADQCSRGRVVATGTRVNFEK